MHACMQLGIKWTGERDASKPSLKACSISTGYETHPSTSPWVFFKSSVWVSLDSAAALEATFTRPTLASADMHAGRGAKFMYVEYACERVCMMGRRAHLIGNKKLVHLLGVRLVIVGLELLRERLDLTRLAGTDACCTAPCDIGLHMSKSRDNRMWYKEEKQ
jgi:hypothetical protein